MTTRAFRREGYPPMTPLQMKVLRQLRAAKADGYPFVNVDAPTLTLNLCVKRDWIFRSPGHDGVRYCITTRGESALAAYEYQCPSGMCAMCGVRPIIVYPNSKSSYCRECRQKRREMRLGRQRRNDGLCPRCGKQPRHQSPSTGKLWAYCKPCSSLVKRKLEKRRHVRIVMARHKERTS